MSCSVGPVEIQLIFFPLETVRVSLLVSTQHTGVTAWSTLTGGGSRLAEGRDMQRGNCSGHMLAQGQSGKVDSAGPPLTGSLPVSVGVSLPQLGPTPLQGEAFGKPRATDGAAQPGPGPCRPLCSFKGQGA